MRDIVNTLDWTWIGPSSQRENVVEAGDDGQRIYMAAQEHAASERVSYGPFSKGIGRVHGRCNPTSVSDEWCVCV